MLQYPLSGWFASKYHSILPLLKKSHKFIIKNSKTPIGGRRSEILRPYDSRLTIDFDKADVRKSTDTGTGNKRKVFPNLQFLQQSK